MSGEQNQRDLKGRNEPASLKADGPRAEAVLPPALSQFEADLASLVPRRDRVDPEWEALLAERASGIAKMAHQSAGTAARSPCEDPRGHEFVCVYCGKGAASISRARRWAWPVAFSAMTAIAAALLLLLTVPPSEPVASNRVEARPEVAGIKHSNEPELFHATGGEREPPAPAAQLPTPKPASRFSMAPSFGPLWQERQLGVLAAALALEQFDEVLTSNLRHEPNLNRMAVAPLASAEPPLSSGELLGRGQDRLEASGTAPHRWESNFLYPPGGKL